MFRKVNVSAVTATLKALINLVELGPKFDPESTGYDYKTATASGGKPNKLGHWGSLDQQTGMVLKGRKHKTWNLMEQEERRRGFKVIKKGKRYYSVPIKQGMKNGT